MTLPNCPRAAIGVGSVLAEITGTDIDIGVTNTSQPTSYSASMTIGDNEACLFIVSKAREVGAAGSRALTVNGVAADLIDSHTLNEGTYYQKSFEVWYIEGVSTGTATVVSSGKGTVSTAITAMMLSATVATVSVTTGQFAVARNGNPVPYDKALDTTALAERELVYIITPTSRWTDEASCYVLDGVNNIDLFPVFAQAGGQFTFTEVVHFCTTLSEGSRTAYPWLRMTSTSWNEFEATYMKIGLDA